MKANCLKDRILRILSNRLLWQLLLCTAAWFILLNIFSGSSEWQRVDYIYTSIFFATLILSVTINSWFVIPHFLNRQRYSLFFLLTCLNILICTLFNQMLFSKLIDYILPGYYFISYYEYTDLLKFFVAFVGLATLLHLSYEWFQLQGAKHRLVLAEKEKINAELKALTNQVNPHFLFNSLTVLYSLALKNSSETPGAIIKLSDILRYVIYESATGIVPIRSEVTLIHNYIALQRYRIAASTRVSFDVDIQNEELPIIPMILLPLVENSFKHGAKGDIENTFINITLLSVNGMIKFNIVNNKSTDGHREEPTGGIGLTNIENRLKLIYNTDYKLTVTETPGTFSVALEIIAER